ncbi:hypothetical protein FQZ97_1009260 [compost metagenome]
MNRTGARSVPAFLKKIQRHVLTAVYPCTFESVIDLVPAYAVSVNREVDIFVIQAQVNAVGIGRQIRSVIYFIQVIHHRISIYIGVLQVARPGSSHLYCILGLQFLFCLPYPVGLVHPPGIDRLSFFQLLGNLTVAQATAGLAVVRRRYIFHSIFVVSVVYSNTVIQSDF